MEVWADMKLRHRYVNEISLPLSLFFRRSSTSSLEERIFRRAVRQRRTIPLDYHRGGLKFVSTALAIAREFCLPSWIDDDRANGRSRKQEARFGELPATRRTSLSGISMAGKRARGMSRTMFPISRRERRVRGS